MDELAVHRGVFARLLFVTLLSWGACGGAGVSRDARRHDAPTGPDSQIPDTGAPAPIELTIVVDNDAVDDRLAAVWGYACVVRGLSRPILFDTGADDTTLLANMELLSLDPGALDLVFLSHDHGDHTAGLVSFLRAAPTSDVYLLESFGSACKDDASAEGAAVHEVTESEPIIDQAHSSGQLGTSIPEQALVIDSADGLIVVTGCAHPGIATIVNAAQDAFDKEVLLVMGGFHLYESTSQQIGETVDALQQLGVKYVAPSHCTGEPAREAFAQAFGTGFLSVGAGSTLRVADLVP